MHIEQKLQQLIEEMKYEFSMATECAESWKEVDGKAYNDFYKEAKAIEKWIPKLEKILNEGSVAAPTDEQSKDDGYDYTQMSGC